MENAPQAITCEYRDGWYIKMFQRISCINGSYQYQIDTHNFKNIDSGKMVTATSKANDHRKPSILFINTDGLALELNPLLGKMYNGKFYWYENSYSNYNNEAHCKIHN